MSQTTHEGKGYRFLARGIEAGNAGRLDEALGSFEAAIAWGQEHGDQGLVDRAFCNHSAAIITLRRSAAPIPRLREILIANRDPETCFLAAYNIARSHELDKAHRKCLFYAQLARDRSIALSNSTWIAWSRNQIGNAKVALSHPDEAADEYRRALKLLGPEPSIWRAVVLENLGYCDLLTGRRGRGFGRLFAALRMMRRLGTESALIHLDLAFAFLEVAKPRSALRHALRGLELANAEGASDHVKNGHYLAGEAARQADDLEMARHHFEQLQRHYPDATFVVDFLLSVDVRPLVNLRA